jgi:hypothetical protein
MSFPVPVNNDLAMLNLPDETRDRMVFEEHEPLVLERLRAISLEDAYWEAFREFPDDSPGYTAFRFSYAFLMLASVVEFLNLKTLGEGIVKTTGFDAQSIELLTGAEIDAFKTTLERRALETLSDYLNPVGRNRLDAPQRPDRTSHPGGGDMSGNELMVAIYKAILEALESRLYLIGSVLDGDARRLTLERGIYDKGDFYNNLGYLVTVEGDGITLHVGSNVKHESFVLGGKVPSWTPLAPIKAREERNHLSWQDKKTGLDLIRNCVMQYRRPFDAALIASLTEVHSIWLYEKRLPAESHREPFTGAYRVTSLPRNALPGWAVA